MPLTSWRRVVPWVVAGCFASSCTSSGPSGGVGALVPPSDSTGPSGSSALTVVSPASCDVVGCVGEGIDTSRGAYTIDVEDLHFPPGLFGIELVRHYRSDRSETGWFGRGWATIFETTLLHGAAGWVVSAPAGLTPLWSPEAPNLWRVAGSPQVKSVASGEAEFVWPSGEVWSFGADGSLRALTSPYGQEVAISQDGPGSVTLRSSEGVDVVFNFVDELVDEVRVDDGGDQREGRFNYSGGLLVGVEAPGLSLQYTYNAGGQIVEQSSPSGATRIDYSSGVVSRQATAAGLRVALSYEVGVTTVSSDHVVTYAHDDEGRLVRVADEGREVLRRRFDDSGRLVESTDAVLPGPNVLRSLTRKYEGDRLVSETIDGVTSAFEYDEQGRTMAVTSGPESVSFEYDGDAPLPSVVVSPGRGRDEIAVDEGFITSVVDATGVVSTTGRDAVGNPISHSKGGGAPWSYEFDSEGNITSTTSPLRRVWRATWGPRSTLVQEIDPLGRTSSYVYDKGRLIEQRLPGVQPSMFGYDAAGRLRTETSPDGQVTRYDYDDAGRLTATTVPGDRVWRSTTRRADSGGSVVTVTAPDGSSAVSQFDTAGREIQRDAVAADGSVQETHRQTYESSLLVETTVIRGSSRFESRSSHDELGRLVTVAESLDGRDLGSTTYGYDGAHLVRASNGDAVTTYGYDPAGRLVKLQTGPDTWEAAYASGSLVSTTHNGAVEQVDYDSDGRAMTFVDSSGTATTWRFDDADRPLTRTVGASRAGFAWSDADQLTTYQAADGSRWHWTYDQLGRLQTVEEPGSETTSYEYDSSQVVRIRTTGDAHDRDDAFSYDALGRLRTAETASGKFEYEYDATGRVASIDGKDDERWSYDAVGQVVAVETGSKVFQLDYDTAGHLTRIAGERDTLQATWSDRGLSTVEVTGRDPLGLTTDADGRLTSVTWDDKTVVDLDWSAPGDRLDIGRRGTNRTDTYDIADGTLTGFHTDKIDITSSRQDNGYLQELQLTQEDLSGVIRFDGAGRPATLVGDNVTATIAYDEQQRVLSILTTRPGQDPDQTTITYTDNHREIDGDGKLVKALFNEDGSQRSPLPSSIANPLSASSDSTAQADGLTPGVADLLVPPEPRPFESVETLIRRATPSVSTPIGVRNLKRLAEQMIVAETARLAPTLRVNGDVSVRLPVIDPDNGELADFNPFVDQAPSGLALGALSEHDGAGGSLLKRAKETLGDIVGGAVDLVADIAKFVIDNPLARLIITSGAWIGAGAACGAFLPACVPAAAVAVLLSAADGAQTLVTAGGALVGACTGRRLTRCGLLAAGVVVAATAAATAGRAGFSLARIVSAERELAAALDSGTGIALASGRVGTAKSELLATLRWQRIVAEERPVCADQVCARVDLVTKSLRGRLRFVEVKNGTGARLTTNQLAVYPMLQSTGAYFPRGLLSGGSPTAIGASILEIQHWGTLLPVSLP